VSERTSPLVIKTARSSYLVVGFLAVGIAPIALYGGAEHPTEATISGLTALYLIPILVAAYIARTATVVTEYGILVRALFGRKALPWSTIRGLSVSRRSVYAVLTPRAGGGAVRLPCTRISDLAAMSAASAGRLPEIPEVTLKPAAGRRR
jgi:hypothetical protein